MARQPAVKKQPPRHKSGLPFAHDVPFWRTSRTSPDIWIDRAKQLLRDLGATDVLEGFAANEERGFFAITFKHGQEKFRIAWPVLPVKNATDLPAARVQAATCVYHDCKNKAMTACILGVRTAFIGYLLLPDGTTVGETTSHRLTEYVKDIELPKLGLKS